ncbi:MAG: aminopeptidase P N-terminal domain-containing protein [Sedimentisphaerales bacterium]|nr:aminopeptidase P N-terminal domain-containing protein [Sedimentisphaerales bacterium]
MFAAGTYIKRRKRLQSDIQSGLILLLGNDESPMNYPDNAFSFRQDSTFAYFFGLYQPGLAAIIDVDEQRECVFGEDVTVDEVIWTGPQPTVKDRCSAIGVRDTASLDKLQPILKGALAKGRQVHILPQYRGRSILQICELFGIGPAELGEYVSEELIRAVVAQRSVKSDEEIREIEAALDIAYEMQTTAMRTARPGLYEREVAGAMEGIAISRGGRLSFPTIFSIHGETLHNHCHGNIMSEGDIAVNDCGAETALGYASDITRTISVGGRFSQKQREIYSVVLDAQQKAIEAIGPGIEFRSVHRLAAGVLLSGLKGLGLVKGDVDEALEAGAHALFFPCGLGHMMGLDVHDMEGLGEDYVGYSDTVLRNPAFGWRSLRLGKALEPGYVITVEPGIYFIGQLIDRWRSEKTCESFIDYNTVEKYKDFGGIRIEDDIVVTESGRRVLGRGIPKTIDEVEGAWS